MTTIISILHHSIPNISLDKIAEEADLGWHFRSAKAIKRHSGLDSECLRPSGYKRWITRTVDGVKVTLAPTTTLPLTQRFWKWNEIAPTMKSYVKTKMKTREIIPYIHEYRTLNSGFLLNEFEDSPMILQHHGSTPPAPRLAGSFDVKGLARAAKNLPARLRERSLNKIFGAFFVLNKLEKEYLEDLGVNAAVRLRTMGVDFEKMTPASPEEKMNLRKRLGLREDSIVLTSYVGLFRDAFPQMKGAHDITRIQQKLRTVFGGKIQIVVTGVCKRVAVDWNTKGILAYEFLSHGAFLDIVRSSDVYFLPATSSYYFGGLGVAIMEALAAGVPVVSPTLTHLPSSDDAKYTGVKTPWVDNRKDLDVFVQNVIFAIENLQQFKPDLIREIASRYYSWTSFVQDLEDMMARWS